MNEMMSTKTKKLTFKKETLRELSQDEMMKVQGGVSWTVTLTPLTIPIIVWTVSDGASCYQTC